MSSDDRPLMAVGGAAAGVEKNLILRHLDGDEEAFAELVDRYRETRRVHPLSPGGNVEEGIRREREALAEVAALADVTIDTSRLNVHQLREAIVRHVVGEPRPTVVNLVSFGFRYGPPH